MTMLSKIQEIKRDLAELGSEIDALPDDNKDGAVSSYNGAVSAIDNLLASVEKYYKDKTLSDQMKVDILARIDESSVYAGLTAEEKEVVAGRIIESSDKKVLSPAEFSEYVLSRLREKSDEELTKIAYSAQDISSLGKAVTEGVQPDLVFYEAGLEVANNFVKTPSGREEALTRGQNRVSKDPKASKAFLKAYYAL